ncbi:MAG TPA: FAD-dependent oxidoreductase [Thermoanaerobaculia bacterium]|jgi:protoporphyrinogen oxidase|nr:FAD-dependent oxidoreductase [Thermoanaerobaculia bacterium]
MTPHTIHRRVGILGGGISGISLAAHLDEDIDVLEKRARIGGLCGSIIDQGFTFDAAGPHIMFSKNKDVLNLMVAALGENVHQRRRENKIWFKGRLVKYPFENDLASLPKEDTFDCLYGYINNPRANDTPHNLEEWSYKTFGAGISEKYFLPYNRKIWNYDPQKIGLEFVSRIPKPPMEDVIKSAIGIPTEGYLHQLHFYYPLEGGYESVVHAFAKRVKGEVTTSWPVAEIELLDEHWHVRSNGGEERLYHELVSTIPIHELLHVWPGAPREARAAASRLRYNSLTNVLLGFSEDRGYPYTAVYVPDPDIVFHRISFPRNFSERSVPAGQSAIMAEITANAGDGIWEMSDDQAIARVISDLTRMELIDPSTVTYKRVIRFTYGYPVYDLDYRKNVTVLRETVERAGIHLLGRFAQFDYINSDVCVERAIALAGEL